MDHIDHIDHDWEAEIDAVSDTLDDTTHRVVLPHSDHVSGKDEPVSKARRSWKAR